MERPEFDRLLTANFADIERAAKKYASIYRRLHEWEDLLQTALLKMLRFADLYDSDKGTLLPWACVVIVNTVKARIAQSMAVPFMEEVNATIPVLSDSTPEEDLQAALILSHLNEETRLYCEGFNYPEIAKLRGFRSRVTAMTRIDNCAADLRRVLGINRERGRRRRMYAKASG